ncbi:membrane protein insertion efficiency factor YidD [bacterium]|nr:membrane protein insertion efficiency factor YidD [bacterium]
MLARLSIVLIRVYRLVLGPWTRGACRFYPSCSHYAEEAFRVHGFWRGLALAGARLLRCHPWHPGGYDPVRPAPPRSR